MLPAKFRVHWPFGSGEEAKHRFSRWPPSWIFDGNDFNYFDLQDIPMLPTNFRINWPFGSVKEAKKRVSRWRQFRIGTILAIFDLKVTPILPTNCRVNWSFCSGEEAKKKKRFSR